MKITADDRAEILDLHVESGSRIGCLMLADELAGQYFDADAEVKRYVCSIEPETFGYTKQVRMWRMHVYYRRNGNCQSPFKTLEERLSDE